MDYKIEEGIELPECLKTGAPYKFPFGVMKVGDSFAIFADEVKKVMSASSYYGKKNNMKFTVSKIHLRCWRVA